MLITCCIGCAEKFGRIYMVTPESRETEGICPFCFQAAQTRQYEMTRPKTRYAGRMGGGERQRAGRRTE